MSEIAKKGWENYMWQLQHRPLPTKAVTAGVLSGISDAAAQKLSGGQKLQLKRLLLRTLFGFAYFGPIGHYKHILLDKIFKGRNDKKTVAKKVIVDQLTASPWNNLVFMMYYGYIVEGRSWREVQKRTKKGFPSLQLTSWMFWPVVGWINFQYMPIQFRVVFQSFVACCWGIFLNLRARALVLNK